MALEQIYFLAEIAAAISVVLSLLYLSIQLRNSRRQSINEFNYIISKERADFLKILASDRELSLIIPLGLVGKLNGKENDYFRFSSYLYHLFVHLELGYRKGKVREIDSELWDCWKEASEWWFRCPGVQLWWQHNLVGGFTKEFKLHVDNTIESVNKEDPNIFNSQLEFLEKAGVQI